MGISLFYNIVYLLDLLPTHLGHFARRFGGRPAMEEEANIRGVGISKQRRGGNRLGFQRVSHTTGERRDRLGLLMTETETE